MLAHRAYSETSLSFKTLKITTIAQEELKNIFLVQQKLVNFSTLQDLVYYSLDRAKVTRTYNALMKLKGYTTREMAV